MNFFFWKRAPLFTRASTREWHFLVEKEGQTALLNTSELEREFQIRFIPQLDFVKWSDYHKLTRKTTSLHRKRQLDEEQLWMGAYYRREINDPFLPAVRLRWIGGALGWGVFAEKDLKPMDYIGEYAGIVRRRKRADAKNAYCFEYVIVRGEKTPYTIDALDQGGIMRFVNHSSSQPNLTSALATTGELSHVIFFVSKPIQKGDQLCYDYGPDYWKNRTAPIL